MKKINYLYATALLLTTGILLSCGNGLEKGSGGSNSGGTQPIIYGPKKVFVIGNDLEGDLKTLGSGANGIDGADKLCMAAPESSGGTYKAFLVDGTHRVACVTANCSGGVSEHVNWVLSPNTEYRQVDGTTIIGITNSKGLFDFPLTNSFSTYSYFLWTGLKTDWTLDTYNCSGFTSNDTQLSGRTGSTNATDATAFSWNMTSCNYYGTSVLCVEQ